MMEKNINMCSQNNLSGKVARCAVLGHCNPSLPLFEACIFYLFNFNLPNLTQKYTPVFYILLENKTQHNLQTNNLNEM